MMPIVNIVGGGLAGSECALYLAERGVDVKLFEMRPTRMTPVHQTGLFSELVCSNSLKSQMLENASGMMKLELSLLESRSLQIAKECRVNAGKALAVDRNLFSQSISDILQDKVEVIRKEVKDFEEFDLENDYVVIATGPMTSSPLLNTLQDLFNQKGLFFFDAVSPIIDSDGIDLNTVFSADRYDQFDEQNNFKPGDYLNCPMNQDEYELFREALVNAQVLPVEDFEKKHLFDRCQPIEEIAKSGMDAMRYGPLKPVGIVDPKTGKEPYSVVQLRKENQAGTMYNLVGFQTRMKWPEQKRIIRMIPGLEQVEVFRYGVMHKNAYINSPALLESDFSWKGNKNLFFAGQITGVEGYVESIASGYFVGMTIYRRLMGWSQLTFPEETMLGGLFNYCTTAEDMKPMYANFGLLPELINKVPKKNRRTEKSKRGIRIMEDYIQQHEINRELPISRWGVER